jgi:hypothetical protein
VRHVWHAEWTLRRVFKKLLADRGHEDALLDESDRRIRKYIAQMEAQDD